MCARLKWSEVLKVDDDDFWVSVRAGASLEECVDKLAVYRWQKNRAMLEQQHKDDVAPGHSFRLLEALIPRDFQRSELRNFDTRILRALLDYILFFGEPQEGARRRDDTEPSRRVDVIRCLRSAIPDHIFEGLGYAKDEVVLNDLGLVSNAARACLLELTEGKSGEGLTGERVMPNLIVDQHAAPKQEEESQPAGNLTGTRETGPVRSSSLTSSMVTGNRSGQSRMPPQPQSFGTAGTNWSEFSDSSHRHIDFHDRRGSLPLLRSQTAQRSPSRKRSMSDIRRSESKRTRTSDRIADPNTVDEDIEHDPEEHLHGSTKRAARKSIASSIIEQTQDLGLAFDRQEAELEQLRATVSTLQVENVDLKAMVRKHETNPSLPGLASSDLAYLKEARAALTEENGRLKDENAVLRTMVKASGLSDEQIRGQMARMKEV